MSSPEATFEADLTVEDAMRFADVSGDRNPLHSDAAYAAQSVYGRQVLHGAFSAGLLSRLAGMYLPGTDCLLYGMRLRFVAPILPPVRVVVRGRIVSGTTQAGRVDCTVSDATSGMVYVEGSYDFGLHRTEPIVGSRPTSAAPAGDPVILVTGTSGGLGGAVLRRLADRALPLRRREDDGRLEVRGSALDQIANGRPIAGIVHCGWPHPDNRRLLELEDPERSIDFHVAEPLRDIQALAALLSQRGTEGAPLLLIGSTATKPGRHYYRMPLYSLAKSTIPTLVDILSLELAPRRRRCFGVIFDMLDGGMNKGVTPSARIANADRSPWGELATLDDAAAQIVWMVENDSRLLSGATVTLTAGAVP